MGNKLSVVKRRQAVYLKLGEKDEEWGCQTSSTYNLLPGHFSTIAIVTEEPTLRKNSDKSPKCPHVSSTNSDNILHFNGNPRSPENQVCEKAPSIQNIVPVAKESKKDPVRHLRKPLGIKYKFKLYPRATVFIPRKYLVSSLRKAVDTNNKQKNKLKLVIQIPTGTNEMLKMNSITSEACITQSSPVGRLGGTERTLKVADNVQLKPNAGEFRLQLKNLPSVFLESTENSKHSCATPDMFTKKISMFDPLSIDTSFDLMPDELLYYYCAFENALKGTSAAHLPHKLSNVHSVRAPVIVESHHQFSSNNFNPVNSEFCSIPCWKGHGNQGCNVAPETTEPDTGAMIDVSTRVIAKNDSLLDKEAATSKVQTQLPARSAVSPDVATKKISVFDPLTIDTSFDLMPDELLLCYRAFENISKATLAAYALQDLSDAHLVRAPVIGGSHHQFSCNNLSPVTSQFCPTPDWKGYDNQGCNVVPETTEPDTGATVPDTQQDGGESYSTYNPDLQHKFWPKMLKKDSCRARMLRGQR